MNLRLKLFILSAILCYYSCKKDLGNYNYHPPSQPVAVELEGNTFNAVVGDSLILRPYISFPGGDLQKDLSYQWEIFVPEESRTETYYGYPLKIVYDLAPGSRVSKLTITDNRNGLKYFYKFNISGGTQFSQGTTVLSVDNGVTKLSFIKPDNRTILADLYSSLNQETLPNNPVQLFAQPFGFQQGTVKNYWIVCQDSTKSSVVIDASSMLKLNTFTQQFFNPPAKIVLGHFEGLAGIATGVINDKLYISVFQTAPFTPDFGKFTIPQAGNYTMSKFYTRTGNFYFAFDPKAAAFISFDPSGNYRGTDYSVNGNAFDPVHVGMNDLVFMDAVSGLSYAFFRDATGTIYELSFNIAMDDYNNSRTINPVGKRVFAGSSLILADSKWQHSSVDIFYFSSNDKIYRYNPLNQSIKQLTADFGGAKVTMLKLSDDGDTLTAGTSGNIYKLNVSVGSNGQITKVITGIPGSPIDLITR